MTLSTTVHNGSMTAASACVWPPTPRPWPLRSLSEAQWQFWEVNGYVAIPDAVPASLVRAAARAIREYVGADDRNRSTWYDNTLDIYADVDADGKKPHHGPAGMVQMFHHASLWAIRQAPNLHAIFSDMWGTEALYVTCDRAHFKPPRDPKYPAWNNPGDVHVGVRDAKASNCLESVEASRPHPPSRAVGHLLLGQPRALQMAPAAAPVRRVSALHPLATKGQRIVGQMAPEAAEAVDLKVRILVNGHTIAVRITAENAADGWKPTVGAIEEISFQSLPSVWGYFSVKTPAAEVHAYADSQFGHIFAHGKDRRSACRLIQLALKRLHVVGEICTNVPYVAELVAMDDFVENRIVWEELLKRFHKVEVTGEPERVYSSFVKGYSELPVRLIEN